MQSGLWSPTGRCLTSRGRIETRMPAVTLPIPTGHNWVLKTSTVLRGKGIQWTPWTHLDDLDFADLYGLG